VQRSRRRRQQHPNHILKLERRKKYKQREGQDKNHNLKIKITWNEISEKYIRKERKKIVVGRTPPLFKTFLAYKYHFNSIKLPLIIFTYLRYKWLFDQDWTFYIFKFGILNYKVKNYIFCYCSILIDHWYFKWVKSVSHRRI